MAGAEVRTFAFSGCLFDAPLILLPPSEKLQLGNGSRGVGFLTRRRWREARDDRRAAHCHVLPDFTSSSELDFFSGPLRQILDPGFSHRLNPEHRHVQKNLFLSGWLAL
jgi:hypothetical protein